MKEILAAVLLVGLLVAAILNIRSIDNLTSEMTKTVNSAVKAAGEDDWETAKKYAQQALEIWNSKDSYTHIIGFAGREIFLKLSPYLRTVLFALHK